MRRPAVFSTIIGTLHEQGFRAEAISDPRECLFLLNRAKRFLCDHSVFIAVVKNVMMQMCVITLQRLISRNSMNVMRSILTGETAVQCL